MNVAWSLYACSATTSAYYLLGRGLISLCAGGHWRAAAGVSVGGRAVLMVCATTMAGLRSSSSASSSVSSATTGANVRPHQCMEHRLVASSDSEGKGLSHRLHAVIPPRGAGCTSYSGRILINRFVPPFWVFSIPCVHARSLRCP